jgi:hypothetical protein
MTPLAKLLAAARACRQSSEQQYAAAQACDREEKWRLDEVCYRNREALLDAASDPALDEAVRELRGCVDLADQVQDAIANLDDRSTWDAAVEIKARIRAALGGPK